MWKCPNTLLSDIFLNFLKKSNLFDPFLRQKYSTFQRVHLKRLFCTDPTIPNDPLNTPSTSTACNNPHVLMEKPVVVIRLECGLPTIIVPLPSRSEKCQFTLRPISDTVGSFCEFLMNEDKGIEQVAIYNSDGIRVAKSTNIQHLLRYKTFRLRINDIYYVVELPKLEKLSGNGPKCLDSDEHLFTMDDFKAKISLLYNTLNIDDYNVHRKNILLRRLEEVQIALRPMEIIRKKIEEECERYSTRVLWYGFTATGFQTGVFARLTWWEYSWDIMEPVTYFATFSTVLATFAYYLMTRQNFEYSSAQRRIFTRQFYKRALLYGLDVQKYNKLSELNLQLKDDLKNLHDQQKLRIPSEEDETCVKSDVNLNPKIWLENELKISKRKKT